MDDEAKWPPRHWLQFSYEHNRLHAHLNGAFSGLWAAAALVAWPGFWFAAVAFAGVAIDHHLDARRARRTLLRLYP